MLTAEIPVPIALDETDDFGGDPEFVGARTDPRAFPADFIRAREEIASKRRIAEAALEDGLLNGPPRRHLGWPTRATTRATGN